MTDLNELANNHKDLQFKNVSRVEVIRPDGREYVRYFKDNESMHYMLQDDNRTLKIFIDKVHKIKLEDL